MNAYAFSFVSIDGAPLPLEQFRGKVLLIVNTASFCGFTKQYEGLQALWERFGGKGLIVVGVPSNDFGGQEPKGEGDILEFCRGSYWHYLPADGKGEDDWSGRPSLLSMGRRGFWTTRTSSLELPQIPDFC